ncbi:sulfur carrier protein ThiS [Verrucomicrobiota bacterium]
MKLIVNGKPYECSEKPSLASLCNGIGADIDRVAVVINDEVIPKTKRESIVLSEGDRIEMLTLASGG